MCLSNQQPSFSDALHPVDLRHACVVVLVLLVNLPHPHV